MFKFSLTITTSVFLFMSGAADLFAMESLYDLDDKSGKQLVIAMTEDAEPGPINYILKDVMGLILEGTSKGVNPRCLISVCKHWYSVMRENNISQMAELHYSDMNPFMQKCMNTYWENQFYNGILRYTPLDNNGKVIEGNPTVTLKFSDFKDGTFDLSACGDTGQYLVITENMNQFFKVGEENKDKSVILIALRHLVEQGINKSKDHSFATRMKAWDADKAPVGMFWRLGNDKNLSWVDYFTTASMSKISSRNLYENWRSAGTGEAKYYIPWFHVYF